MREGGKTGRTGGRRGSRKLRVRRVEDEKPKLHAGDGWPQPLPLFVSGCRMTLSLLFHRHALGVAEGEETKKVEGSLWPPVLCLTDLRPCWASWGLR